MSLRKRLRRATTVVEFERFDALARRAIALANVYAVDSQQPTITTEHLACALVTSPVREQLGLAPTLDDVGRALTERGFQLGTTTTGIVTDTGFEMRPFATDVKALIVEAVGVADTNGQPVVGSQHLLLALLDRPRSPGARVLVDLGVDPAAVAAWSAARPPNEGPPSDPT